MLSRETILEAFTQLSNQLGSRGVLGELSVVGGTAMVLAFNARSSTKDVYAIFEPSFEVRKAAAAVAEAMSLSADWLNDAARGFLSETGEFTPIESIDLPNLRVQAPTLGYMLAMKVMAARAAIGEERGDMADIAFLIRRLGLRDANQIMDIVSCYYDPSKILPRSFYLVDEILEGLEN